MSHRPSDLFATVLLQGPEANDGAPRLQARAWQGVVQEMRRNGDTCTFTIVAHAEAECEKPVVAVRFTDDLRQALGPATQGPLLIARRIRRNKHPPPMPREIVIARMRSVLDRLSAGQTQVAIAQDLGVSANRIRQLRDKALHLRKLGRL